MTEREAYIALNMMERIGPVSVRSLAAELGSVVAIFDASAELLRRAKGIGPAVAELIVRQRGELDVAAELECARAAGVRVITPLDAEYPDALREIHDPPLALYVRGKLRPVDRNAVAVVGTRRATHYGMDTARRFSYQLARSGISVLSGLALGVDTAAHKGALQGGGRTVAVIGGGFNHLYPEENRRLADEIAEQGAVLSEFPMGRKPDRTTFPMRNRIVSGMSKGVLVVEAGLRSGAVITASLAMEQGRTVFAVPGRIDSFLSAGSNALIKDGACVVTEARDILEHFEMLLPPERPPENRAGAADTPGLPDEAVDVVHMLARGEMGIDTLIRESGMSAAKMSSLLVRLELKKIIRMLPGRKVELTG